MYCWWCNINNTKQTIPLSLPRSATHSLHLCLFAVFPVPLALSLTHSHAHGWMNGWPVLCSDPPASSHPHQSSVSLLLSLQEHEFTLFSFFLYFFFLPSLSCRLLLPDPLNSLCQQCGHLHARESVLFLCLYVFSCIIFRSLCFRSLQVTG